MRIDDSSGTNVLPPPEQFFPDWRSVELFGIPGSGKSYYCRGLIRSHGVFSTCDDQIARHQADLTIGWAGRLMKSVMAERLYRNYGRLRMKREVADFRRHSGAEIGRYFDSVEDVIDKATLSPRTRKNVRDSTHRTAAYLSLARDKGWPLVVDEGLLRKLSTVIARSVPAGVAPQLRDAIVRCLQLYPWERNALLLETSKATALERQRGRDHVIRTAARPIDDFFAATGLLSDLLSETGWRLAQLRND